MTARSQRVRNEALARTICGLIGGGVMLVGIVVGRNTDYFWVTLVAIALAGVAGYFAMGAVNKRWP